MMSRCPFLLKGMCYERQEEVSPDSRQRAGSPHEPETRLLPGTVEATCKSYGSVRRTHYRFQKDGQITGAWLVFNSRPMLHQNFSIADRDIAFDITGPETDRRPAERGSQVVDAGRRAKGSAGGIRQYRLRQGHEYNLCRNRSDYIGVYCPRAI